MTVQAVLIVDDNVEFAVLIGTLIGEQGLTPVLAHTAQTALVLAKQCNPAAIILDLLLPDMTGHKLIGALERAGIKAPFFVMTGVFTGEALMERVRAIAPIKGWFEKPFDTGTLVEEVVQALGGQRVVVRRDHQPDEYVTPEFDINILEPDAGAASDPLAPEAWPNSAFELPIEPPSEDFSEDAPSSDGGEVVVDDLLLNQTNRFSKLAEPRGDAVRMPDVLAWSPDAPPPPQRPPPIGAGGPTPSAAPTPLSTPFAGFQFTPYGREPPRFPPDFEAFTQGVGVTGVDHVPAAAFVGSVPVGSPAESSSDPFGVPGAPPIREAPRRPGNAAGGGRDFVPRSEAAPLGPGIGAPAGLGAAAARPDHAGPGPGGVDLGALDHAPQGSRRVSAGGLGAPSGPASPPLGPFASGPAPFPSGPTPSGSGPRLVPSGGAGAAPQSGPFANGPAPFPSGPTPSGSGPRLPPPGAVVGPFANGPAPFPSGPTPSGSGPRLPPPRAAVGPFANGPAPFPSGPTPSGSGPRLQPPGGHGAMSRPGPGPGPAGPPSPASVPGGATGPRPSGPNISAPSIPRSVSNPAAASPAEAPGRSSSGSGDLPGRARAASGSSPSTSTSGVPRSHSRGPAASTSGSAPSPVGTADAATRQGSNPSAMFGGAGTGNFGSSGTGNFGSSGTGNFGSSGTGNFGSSGTGAFGLGGGTPTAQQMRAGLRAKMRAGAIRPTTVPRLLTAFHIAQETGEIAFERGQERKVVYFAEGRPVHARSNQDADRLGVLAKRTFNLTSVQIEGALRIARETDRMLGSVLIEQGLLDERLRQDLLREQTRTIIKSLLTWSDGRYVIGFNVQADLEHADLKDSPASLVLASVREMFDLERLRALVPDRMKPAPAPNPPYELFDLGLGDAEAFLLLRTTGVRSAKALIKDISPRLDEKGARALLYGLLALGILVAGGPAATPRAIGPVG